MNIIGLSGHIKRGKIERHYAARLGFQNVAVDHIDNREAANLTEFYYKEMNGQFAGTKSDLSNEMNIRWGFNVHLALRRYIPPSFDCIG